MISGTLNSCISESRYQSSTQETQEIMTVLKTKSFWMRQQDIRREWFHLNAGEKRLGKLAVKAANLLMGKEKPTFTPGVDTGDYVVVTNASLVQVTGRKREDKNYQRFTGYSGGQIDEKFHQLLARKPERVIELAVRRMLPKTILGRQMLKRLRIFAGNEHTHTAQNPRNIDKY